MSKKNKKRCAVYALRSVMLDSVIFIGQTRLPLKVTMGFHLKNLSEGKATSLYRFWGERLAMNDVIEIVALQSGAMWNVQVVSWIERFTAQGAPLQNMTDGRNLSPATLRKKYRERKKSPQPSKDATAL